MTKQRHIVKKCIVELEVTKKEGAYELQQKAGNIVRHKLAELLEKHCDELSGENVLHRIEKLEIDVGSIQAENLEKELTERVEVEFKNVLKTIVDDYERSGKTSATNKYNSKQELLTMFITTGSLPWWADVSNKHLLTDTVSELIKKEPKQKLHKFILRDNRYLLRFINHLHDDLLEEIIEFPSKGSMQLYGFIRSNFEAMKSLKHISKSRIRQIVWSAIYKSSYNKPNVDGLIMLVIKNVSEQLGLNFKLLSDEFASAINNRADSGTFMHICDALRKVSKTFSNSEKSAVQKEASESQGTEPFIDKEVFNQIINQVYNVTNGEFSVDKINTLLARVLKFFPGEVANNIYSLVQLIEKHQKSVKQAEVSIKNNIRSMLQHADKEYAKIKHLLQGINRRVELSEYIDAYLSLLANNWFSNENIDKPAQALNHKISLLGSMFQQFKLDKRDDQPVNKELFKKYLFDYYKGVSNSHLINVVKSSINLFDYKDTNAGNIRAFINGIIGQFVDLNFHNLLNDAGTSGRNIEVHSKEENLRALLSLFFQSPQGKIYMAVVAKTFIPSEENSKKEYDLQKKLQLSKELLAKAANELISDVKQLEKKLQAQVKENKQKKQQIVQANDEDEIFITNAGLVLLAPFIKYLFMALEYSDEHTFKNTEAQHRAILLLNYLCAPSNQISEYLLPLCKILCGLSPEELVDIEFEPTEQEASECENLISVVIERAAIFKNLSNDGFRGSFLLRDGKLSQQNNSWLLQVEKKTHDILLDKIPWNYKIIKLPWMDTVLQVEW